MCVNCPLCQCCDDMFILVGGIFYFIIYIYIFFLFPAFSPAVGGRSCIYSVQCVSYQPEMNKGLL